MFKKDSLGRELAACASILIAGALITIALAFAVVAFDHHTESQPTTTTHVQPVCDSDVDVVTVWVDDPTPCNLTTQRLDVAGLTFGNDRPDLVCADMGGEWIGDGVDICQGVDK